MSKKYALIEGYGKMIVPVSMLEKIANECYIGRTEYSDGRDVLIEVLPVGRVELLDQQDINDARAQMELSR